MVAGKERLQPVFQVGLLSLPPFLFDNQREIVKVLS